MNGIIQAIQQLFNSMSLTSDDFMNLIFSLLLSTMIAIVISQIYKLTNRGVSFEIPFMTSLVLIAPIVNLVMLFIQGNLVLSLGLVGSLSIIRFRTPIKDTRDMVFLFWSIVVGLGTGTYNWYIVTIASIFIGIVVIVLYLIKYGKSQPSDYILVLTGSNGYLEAPIMDIIHDHVKEAKLRSQKINGENWEIVVEARLHGEVNSTELLMDLKKVTGITNISFLAPQLSLPI